MYKYKFLPHYSHQSHQIRSYHRSTEQSWGMPIIIIPLYITQINTSSTLYAVLAEVSRKIRSFSLANFSPSSYDTARLYKKFIPQIHNPNTYSPSISHLLPTKINDIWGLPFCLASSSQRVRWLNVSLLYPVLVTQLTYIHFTLWYHTLVAHQQRLYNMI